MGSVMAGQVAAMISQEQTAKEIIEIWLLSHKGNGKSRWIF